jgi:hypothetical protein
MQIGALTIEFGKHEPPLRDAPEGFKPTVDEHLRIAEGAHALIEEVRETYGESATVYSGPEVEKVLREAREAKAAEEVGRLAITQGDNGTDPEQD